MDFSWRWYASRLMQNGLVSVQLVLATVLVECFGLTLPFFYIVIFDRVFGRSNLATLDVIAVGVLVILSFDLIIKVLRAWLMNYQTQLLNRETTQRVLDVAMDADAFKQQTGRIAPATWVEGLLGQLQRNQSTVMLVFSGVFDAGFALVILVLLLLMHPLMALVALAPVIPVVLYQLWHAPREKQRAKSAMQAMERYKARFLEILTQRETLSLTSGLTTQRDDLAAQLNAIQSGHRHHRLDQLGQGNVPGFFINLGSMVTLYVGAHLVLAGQLSFGVYLAINMISRNVLGAVQKFLATWLQYQEQHRVLETQIMPVLAAQRQTSSSIRQSTRPEVVLDQPRGELTVTELRFAYPASGEDSLLAQPVLRDVSLVFQPGEKIVLAGKSGSGKSTLCHLLARLHTPSHGLVTLDGTPVDAIEETSFRRALAYLPQNPGLLAGTLEDNIGLANPQANLKDILEAAKLAGLDEALQQSEHGLKTPVTPMGLNLSESIKKRVMLARLFLSQPSVVILDSVFNRFSADLRAMVLQNLHQHCPRATMIYVTQYLPLHQQSDRIIVLDEGKVVEIGGFETLLSAKGVYYGLYATPPAPASSHSQQGDAP